MKLPAPYHEWPGVGVLYCGDCLEILPLLEAGSVDAVVTDPPYGIGYGEYESHEDDPEKYPALIAALIPACERIISDGWMCVFQAAKTAPMWSLWFQRPYRPLALPKTFVQILPTLGPTWATDYALLWPVGKPDERGKLRDWFVCETSDMSLRPKGHPCPRPVAGIVHCVEMLSEPQQVIVDTFLGSGTTAVACIRTGRRFIGIELEPKYCAIAKARIDRELAQPRLPFIEPVKETQAEMFGADA